MTHTLAEKIINSVLIIVPAYGRKYASEQAVATDWNSGKDFKVFRGPYISIRDIEAIRGSYSTAFIKYDSGLLEI